MTDCARDVYLTFVVCGSGGSCGEREVGVRASLSVTNVYYYCCCYYSFSVIVVVIIIIIIVIVVVVIQKNERV